MGSLLRDYLIPCFKGTCTVSLIANGRLIMRGGIKMAYEVEVNINPMVHLSSGSLLLSSFLHLYTNLFPLLLNTAVFSIPKATFDPFSPSLFSLLSLPHPFIFISSSTHVDRPNSSPLRLTFPLILPFSLSMCVCVWYLIWGLVIRWDRSLPAHRDNVNTVSCLGLFR